LQKE
jgi:hypothetical protein